MQKIRETIQDKAFRLCDEYNTDPFITEKRRDDIRTWLYNHDYILRNRARTWRLMDRHTREFVKQEKGDVTQAE